MTAKPNFVINSRAHSQHGFSLVIVLILLVVMSVLGLAVLRSSGMQERMTANLRDRSLAFQAAETTLRIAQQDVLNNPVISDLQYGKTLTELRAAGKPVDCATHGFCDSSLATPEVPVVMTAPDGHSTYTIEYLGTGKGSTLQGVCETTAGPANYQCQRPMFRITATGRSVTPTGTVGLSEVVLQANVVSR